MSESRSLRRISKIPSAGSRKAQHVPVSRAQIRPTGQELVQRGLAVRKAVLKREPVDGVDRFVLDQYLTGTGALPHEPLQMPFERRTEREAHQDPFSSALLSIRQVSGGRTASHPGRGSLDLGLRRGDPQQALTAEGVSHRLERRSSNGFGLDRCTG
jgi:hypothetical protein